MITMKVQTLQSRNKKCLLILAIAMLNWIRWVKKMNKINHFYLPWASKNIFHNKQAKYPTKTNEKDQKWNFKRNLWECLKLGNNQEFSNLTNKTK